jgi:hypothetical protein
VLGFVVAVIAAVALIGVFQTRSDA